MYAEAAESRKSYIEVFHIVFGNGHSSRETPDPIPNSTVKPAAYCVVLYAARVREAQYAVTI